VLRDSLPPGLRAGACPRPRRGHRRCERAERFGRVPRLGLEPILV